MASGFEFSCGSASINPQFNVTINQGDAACRSTSR